MISSFTEATYLEASLLLQASRPRLDIFIIRMSVIPLASLRAE